MNAILGLLAVFALVFLNGFFVAAEFSFVGARRTRITQLVAEGRASARAAEYAITHLDSTIAATQLGITLASLGLGWIGEPAIAHLIEPVIELVVPGKAVSAVMHSVAVAISFSLVTMLHIVLGELTPKSIALQRPESTSLVVARPVTWFLALFRPVIRLMNGVGNGVVRLLGFEPASDHARVHSAEELEMLVHSSQEAGILQESEEILLRRVFDFSEIDIVDVMQPRVEVDSIAADMPLPDLLKQVSVQHRSRYPVYRESMDNVVGLLHTKDLFDAIIHRPELMTGGAVDFDLESILRKPLFVPETVSVDKVLEQMQRTKTHAAIVMDEYGGMAGMATMEDILEELVGEVRDEFDRETAPVSSEGDVAVLDGLVTMDDVIERFGKPESEPRSTTLGGYMAERLGRIPNIKDKIPFGEYEVCVAEMDGMRVARVRFIRRSREAAAPPAAESAEKQG